MTQTTPNPSESAEPSSLPQTEAEGPIRVKRLSFRASPPEASQPETPQDPNPVEPAAAGPGEPTNPAGTSDAPREPKSTKSGSSQASSLVDQKLISEGIEGTVIAITGQLHELLARDAYEEWAQVYLADEQDAKGIAQPVTRIISRRTGEITGGNPDISDGIFAGIAVVFYLVKQLGRLLAAKRARRVGANIFATPKDPGPAANDSASGIPAGSDRFA